MNKQQLAAKIWESANKMRSKIEANEYKDYILGFIFYKFLSEKEEKFLFDKKYDKESIKTVTEESSETVEYVQDSIGYFISYENLFQTWIEKGKDFDISDVSDALNAFGRLIKPSQRDVFDGIFNTLQTGLTKLGDSAASRTKAVRDLIHLIKEIPMDGKQDYDVLGFIYEYLISMFAANAGKKAGEFYTPHEVSLLMSEIVANHLKDNGKDKIEIYDSTSGSGSLLINIGKSVARYVEDNNNIKYYAQELKQNTYNLTRMNLVMRGIVASNIITRNGDTLEDDWPYFDERDPKETYEPLYVDAVVSNPPYSQNWESGDKDGDARFADYGLAPKGKADYAFLLHDLFHIKNDGIMTIVLPHGVLFRGGEEGTIRKNLIEKNKIDAIIGLPANIFFGTGIPTIIMVLKKERENTDVLIIDASKGFTKEGKNNKLRASDVKKITDTVVERSNIEKYSKVVSREEIRNNDYNLNIPRYVDSSDAAETWDIYASMFGGIPKTELDCFDEWFEVLPNLKTDLFEKQTETSYVIKSNEVKKIVCEHEDVKLFMDDFNNRFLDLNTYLKKEIIENMETLRIPREEAILSKEIFDRMNGLKLLDKYEAYQLLDDTWDEISVDLEIIQMEGKTTITAVDPNMVLKKKNGKEQEVQEGYVGRIIPFELVQRTVLKEDTAAIKEKELRLENIIQEYDERLDELSEEDREKTFVNDANDAFVIKEVKKAIKDGDVEGETIEILKKVKDLNEEEKDLKKQIKEDKKQLEELAKNTIENMSEEQYIIMLEEKWIKTLIDKLYELPQSKINYFIDKINALVKKYETTYSDIEKDIKETEMGMINLIDQLEGNEVDMLGMNELKVLLGGGNDE